MASTGFNPTTNTGIPVPWHDDGLEAPESVLQLVVAWFQCAPARVGQTAPVEGPCFLGRLDSRTPDELPLPFFEARPGQSLATARVGDTLLLENTALLLVDSRPRPYFAGPVT